MLLLKCSYGFDNCEYVGISLISDHENYDHYPITEILRSFSCYPPAIPKIIACLDYSGRYDCLLQRTWFERQKVDVYNQLKTIGVTLIIRSIKHLDEIMYYNQNLSHRDLLELNINNSLLI